MKIAYKISKSANTESLVYHIKNITGMLGIIATKRHLIYLSMTIDVDRRAKNVNFVIHEKNPRWLPRSFNTNTMGH